MQFIKKIPLPISGLALSISALGNLLGSYSSNLRLILGLLSATIIICILLKFALFFEDVKQDLKNPIIASVCATITMTMIVLSAYIKDFTGINTLHLWEFSILMHFFVVGLIIKNFILKFDINNIFPSSFIPFIGFSTASVTARTFDKLYIGQYLFYLSLAFYIILLPIILYRVFKVRNIPHLAKTTMAVITAPPGLMLSGYMSSFDEKNIAMVTFLVFDVVVSYSFVLSQLPSIFKSKFHPGFSALTFPLVICAVGLKMSNAMLPLIYFTHIMAVFIVWYVLFGYIDLLFRNEL